MNSSESEISAIPHVNRFAVVGLVLLMLVIAFLGLRPVGAHTLLAQSLQTTGHFAFFGGLAFLAAVALPHLLPWTQKPIQTYTDNIMLIGDAGGFPCPLEAEGVFPAMETGKLAAETAIKCIADGDTSKNALKLYEDKWKKSSTGIEFSSGGESLQTLWKNLFFSTQSEKNNMEWFIPLWHEFRGGHYDWSEPHIIRMRQMMNKMREYLPEVMPFVQKYVMPVLSDVLEEDMGLLPLLTKMMEGMRPRKKK